MASIELSVSQPTNSLWVLPAMLITTGDHIQSCHKLLSIERRPHILMYLKDHTPAKPRIRLYKPTV